MKKISVLFIMLLTTGVVNAENLFPNSNPFPQTAPQSMNNIYEAEPSVINHEQTKRNKAMKWFKKNKNVQQTVESSDYVVPRSKVIHEGVQDGSYYIFR